MMRVCKKCLVDKPIEEYHKGKGSKDGRIRVCKACIKVVNQARYQSNKERISENNKRWVSCNRERKRQINLKSQRNNSGKRYQTTKAWRERNPARVREHNAKYRAAKQNATPLWLNDDHLTEISYLYSLAKECEVLSGDKYHVDHIIPLNGKDICGLHVPWNLQVLPADVNIRKSNSTFG